MKGLEFKLLAEIILIVVIIILLISIFILPVYGKGKEMPQEKDFRWLCIFWSAKSYRGTTVTIDSETYSMNKPCTTALGKVCIDPNGECMSTGCGLCENADDWNKCRDACRIKKPEVSE
jgi:hypothetical protein